MKRDFKSLFRVEVLHEYYTDRICRDLIFTPTVECQSRLNGLRLTMRSQHNGIEILYTKDHNHQKLIEIPAGTHLKFLIGIKNNFFYNYSNTSKKEGYTCYFSNHKPKGNGIEISIDHSAFPDGTFLYSYLISEKSIIQELTVGKEKHLVTKLLGYLDISTDHVNDGDRYFLTWNSKKIVWRYQLRTMNGSSEYDYAIRSKNDRNSNRYANISFHFHKTDEKKQENGWRTTQFSSVKQHSSGIYDVEGNEIIGTDIPTTILDPKSVARPPFELEYIDSKENLVLRRGAKSVTKADHYRKITLGESSVLHVNKKKLSAERIIMGRRSKIIFDQDCKVSIKTTLMLSRGAQFNADDQKVFCLIGTKRLSRFARATVCDGAYLSATLFTYGILNIKSSKSHFGEDYRERDDDHSDQLGNEEILMKGIFIAAGVIDGKNVVWIQNQRIPIGSKEFELQEIPLFEENKSHLQLIQYKSGIAGSRRRNLEEVVLRERVIIENLPNPSIKHINPEVLIHL